MQELNIQELSMAAGGFGLKDIGDAIGRAIDKVKEAIGGVSGRVGVSGSIEHCTTVTTNNSTVKQCESYSGKAEASGSASAGNKANGRGHS